MLILFNEALLWPDLSSGFKSFHSSVVISLLASCANSEAGWSRMLPFAVSEVLPLLDGVEEAADEPEDLPLSLFLSFLSLLPSLPFLI